MQTDGTHIATDTIPIRSAKIPSEDLKNRKTDPSLINVLPSAVLGGNASGFCPVGQNQLSEGICS